MDADAEGFLTIAFTVKIAVALPCRLLGEKAVGLYGTSTSKISCGEENFVLGAQCVFCPF